MAEDKPISFIVDPDKRFAKAVAKAIDQVGDIKLPLQLIAKQWFQSNKAFFALKSEGKFIDLKDSTKDYKERNYGFIYPILRAATGNLESSITSPEGSNSINLIINNNSLVLGTSVPYASYLQFGTKKMAARPFVMIGAEQTGPDEFNQRRQRWIELIQNYVKAKLEPVGEIKK